MESDSEVTSLRDKLTAVFNSKLGIVFELTFVFSIGMLHLIPVSDTPVWLLFGWFVLWARRMKWRDIGLRSPKSWGKTIGLALGIGVSWSFLDMYLVEPLLASITGIPIDLSQFEPVKGNMIYFLILFGIGWTLAAFGEEMVYRGYLMNRIADLLGHSKLGWSIAIVLVSIGFGFAHAYQGTSGMIATGYWAAVVGLLYLASGKNLWLPILVHGIYDSVGITFIYLGIYPAMLAG